MRCVKQEPSENDRAKQKDGEAPHPVRRCGQALSLNTPCLASFPERDQAFGQSSRRICDSQHAYNPFFRNRESEVPSQVHQPTLVASNENTGKMSKQEEQHRLVLAVQATV